MISKRFVKLGILVYYKYSGKYEVKMTLLTYVYCLPYFAKSLEERVVEIKNVLKSFLKFTFGQGSCCK